MLNHIIYLSCHRSSRRLILCLVCFSVLLGPRRDSLFAEVNSKKSIVDHSISPHELRGCSLLNSQLNTSWLTTIPVPQLKPQRDLLQYLPSGSRLRIKVNDHLTLPRYFEHQRILSRLITKAPHRVQDLMIIGDSLSATSHFITCLKGVDPLSLPKSWRSTLQMWFSRGPLSVFQRESFSAQHGATTWEILTPRELKTKGAYGAHRLKVEIPLTEKQPPLLQEIYHNHSRYAAVLLGTNDLRYHKGFERFSWRYLQLVETLLEAGVFPIIQTIPPLLHQPPQRNEQVRVFNQFIRAVAAIEEVALVDFHSALHKLTHKGLRKDGIHLNAYAGGCRFSSRGLRFGHNLRNYIFLESYTKLKAREDGALQSQQPPAESKVRLSHVDSFSPLLTSESPCQARILRRARRASRWRKSRRREKDRKQKEGPPLYTYGEWRFERQAFTLNTAKRVSLISLLFPVQKRDLSEAQLWLYQDNGHCTPLVKTVEHTHLARGNYELLHIVHTHYLESVIPNSRPINKSSSAPRSHRALLSW